MDTMDQQRITIERFLAEVFTDLDKKLDVVKADDSSQWSKCGGIISFLFHVLALLVLFFIVPILVGVRLAVTHADRVVFVFASAILSFFQVPHKVFYVYIAVLAVTGFLQFLRYQSTVRSLFLYFLSQISCGTSNLFLRKFTTLHFNNPFNRCLTRSKVIYVPVGFEIPSEFSHIEVFDFPVSELLSFDKMVGSCEIKIETVDNIINSDSINNITRVFTLNAPWGQKCFTIKMKNDNLGKLINYFDQVIETKCSELICTLESGSLEALSLFGTIKHFNSELQLVKLENDSGYVI